MGIWKSLSKRGGAPCRGKGHRLSIRCYYSSTCDLHGGMTWQRVEAYEPMLFAVAVGGVYFCRCTVDTSQRANLRRTGDIPMLNIWSDSRWRNYVVIFAKRFYPSIRTTGKNCNISRLTVCRRMRICPKYLSRQNLTSLPLRKVQINPSSSYCNPMLKLSARC